MIKKNSLIICLLSFVLLSFKQPEPRVTQDFNFDWQFHLGDLDILKKIKNNEQISWKAVRLPHDWSAEQSFTQINTGSSTGFLPAGIGFYKKDFTLNSRDKNKVITINFDGVYNNAQVWINNVYLGERPNGYISFGFDLSPHLNFGNKKNTLVVKVNRRNYIDSRWYTGSGIYRDVKLIKTERTYIPKWGVFINTPKVSKNTAAVNAEIDIALHQSSPYKNIQIKSSLINPAGDVIGTTIKKLTLNGSAKVDVNFDVLNPKLWSLTETNLYKLHIEILSNRKVIDQTEQEFGIRTIKFDANKGFFLNGVSMKLKGVNLHHEAGAVGAAVPIDMWVRRLSKLKEIGCNAIRTSHNPVDPKFLTLCDKMGFLVIAEFFDEWNIPKDKDLYKLGDKLAPDSVSQGYSKKFDSWAERDLKDCIKRDRNHPSIIMWSIGNEIEWTYPMYAKAYEVINGKQEYYSYHPRFDTQKIKYVLDSLTNGKDSLVIIAKKLANWVKQTDTTRATTCGSVLPSIGLASGYADAVDVLGFNYRASEYDGAHQAYPNLLIYGSENWGAYSEWKNCIDRDFVAGIFCWTGFAYAGESGPWPYKGLEISFFDFAGFKTPRGHFFETLWKPQPKVYLCTTPEKESEFKHDGKGGFTAEIKKGYIRRWGWYDVYEKWNYPDAQNIIVQVYSNCEENELFLNGKSLGKKKLRDVKADDHILKWLVPYQAGELKVVGYAANGEILTQNVLKTDSTIQQLELSVDKSTLKANNYDVVHVEARLKDIEGNLVTNMPLNISFEVDEGLRLLGIDNGAPDNVQDYKSYTCTSSNGKVLLILQAKDIVKTFNIKASASNITSNIKIKTVDGN